MSEPTAYEQAVQRFTAYMQGPQALVGVEQVLRDIDTIRMELLRRQLAYRRGVQPLDDDDPPEAA